VQGYSHFYANDLALEQMKNLVFRFADNIFHLFSRHYIVFIKVKRQVALPLYSFVFRVKERVNQFNQVGSELCKKHPVSPLSLFSTV